jgi:hypothetical protein
MYLIGRDFVEHIPSAMATNIRQPFYTNIKEKAGASVVAARAKAERM